MLLDPLQIRLLQAMVTPAVWLILIAPALLLYSYSSLDISAIPVSGWGEPNWSLHPVPLKTGEAGHFTGSPFLNEGNMLRLENSIWALVWGVR